VSPSRIITLDDVARRRSKRQREIRVCRSLPGPRWPGSLRLFALHRRILSFENAVAALPGESQRAINLIVPSTACNCCTAGASARPLLCAWLGRETSCQPPNQRHASLLRSHRRPSPVRARRVFEDAWKVLKPPWKPPNSLFTAHRPSEGSGTLFPGRHFRHHTNAVQLANSSADPAGPLNL